MPTSDEEVEALESQVADLRDQIEQARRGREEVQASRVNDQRADELKREVTRLNAQLSSIKQDTEREVASGTGNALKAMQDAVQKQADEAANSTPTPPETPATPGGAAQSAPIPTGTEAKASASADVKATGQEGR